MKKGNSIGRFGSQHQQNVKNGKIFKRKVNVLLPTQYEPQFDVMLNQNAVIMAKRAQELARNQYLKNKFN